MFITASQWEALTPHIAVGRHLPPGLTYSTIAALLPDEEVIAAHGVYDISQGEQTSWSHWVLTEGHIVRTELRFGAKWYTQEEENDEHTPRPQTKVIQGWKRRRSDISQVAFANIGRITNSKAPHWFDTGDVTVTFADRASDTIRCAQYVSDPGERERLNRFLKELLNF